MLLFPGVQRGGGEEGEGDEREEFHVMVWCVGRIVVSVGLLPGLFNTGHSERSEESLTSFPASDAMR